MQSSNKHSTIKGLLITLRAWSRDTLHGKPYRLYHTMHGRPDKYKNKARDTVRKLLGYGTGTKGNQDA